VRLVPAQETFVFDSVASFEKKALAVSLGWAEWLKGQSFHARLHRRRGDLPVKLSSLAEERALDEALLRKLTELERPGRIEFDDPDFVIDIETVGNRAGMSIWSREDRSALPFLRLD
jgi:tRNA(Ser,Leu) C12 N-acetylase TAN1